MFMFMDGRDPIIQYVDITEFEMEYGVVQADMDIAAETQSRVLTSHDQSK